jgi:hypothetical protein
MSNAFAPGNSTVPGAVKLSFEMSHGFGSVRHSPASEHCRPPDVCQGAIPRDVLRKTPSLLICVVRSLCVDDTLFGW